MGRLVSVLVFMSVAGVSLLALTAAPRPCTEPLSYSLGYFDERFGIEREGFMEALSEAEGIWEEASGRNLFVYTETGGELPVNLIYDYRQEATEELNELGREVETDEAQYRALERRFGTLKEEYDTQKAFFDTKLEAFNQRSEAYERQVDKWNSGPRNSKEEFEALEREREAINDEAIFLNNLEMELNQKAEEVNRVVKRLNDSASSLNLAVDEYNQVGSSRGETFEGGVYFESGKEKGINVYEFSSHNKLVRVLAHELGHALGLEHVLDSKSLMYERNDSNSLIASESDLAALEILCGAESW